MIIDEGEREKEGRFTFVCSEIEALGVHDSAWRKRPHTEGEIGRGGKKCGGVEVVSARIGRQTINEEATFGGKNGAASRICCGRLHRNE